MCGELIPNIDRVVMQEMEGRLREVYRANMERVHAAARRR